LFDARLEIGNALADLSAEITDRITIDQSPRCSVVNPERCQLHAKSAPGKENQPVVVSLCEFFDLQGLGNAGLNGTQQYRMPVKR